MTKYPDLWAALAAHFRPEEEKIREKPYRAKYVTARTVQNRLDAVLGPENWWPAFRSNGEHSTMCALTLRLPDGSTLTKEDAGGNAGMSDAGDDDKSGVSDAFKRAAVMFGVGRYLYGDGVPRYAVETEGPAEPEPTPIHRNGTGQERNREIMRGKLQHQAGAPTTGKALFGWAKENGWLEWLSDSAKAWKFPFKTVEWNREQVAHAWKCIQEQAAAN